MARDASGNFSLVAGNPVQSGEIIASTWANNTLNDVATALTDSLDRNGRGGMLAPFRFADGTNLLPGAAWVNETTTGFYRFDGGDLRITVLTQDVQRWQSTGSQLWNIGLSQWDDILTAGGTTTQVPVNIGTAEGQTLYWDATTDSEWKPTGLLTTDVANNRVAVGLATGLQATFTALQSSSLRAWTADASTVALLERSADARLTIAGGNINAGIITFGDTDAEYAGQLVYDHNDDSMAMYVAAAADPAMLIDAVGNVGIGTDSPLHQVSLEGGSIFTKWQVAGSTGSPNTPDEILTYGIDGNAATYSSIKGFNEFASNLKTGLAVYTSDGATSIERMRIDSAGNVGIGTDIPVVELDVVGSVLTQGVGGGFVYGRESTLGTTAGSALLGLYGQGTTPTAGNFNSTYILQTAEATWTDTSTPSKIAFGTTAVGSTSATERMRIDSSGIVSGTWSNHTAGNASAKMMKLTQAQYDALTPDADTMYFIVG